jgi:DNA-binding SARP family transcriptional activator/DNA-binding NarL/FixJ family response regulator
VVFRLLGPLEVSDRERPVRFGEGRHRSVLVLLLLHRNEPVASDRLIDALWGEAPPPTAAKVLQNYVGRLRRALGDREGRRLQTRGRAYTLRVEDGEVDVDRFERLVCEGSEALADERPADAAAYLREGLALWRGPPLADVAYEGFAQGEIARLEERRAVALERRIEADLALGRHADLVSELEALVARHPLRERLRGQRMLALYRCGRQADALEAFHHARRRLVEEVGVEPGPELRGLHEAILRQDPSLDLAPREPRHQLDAGAARAIVGPMLSPRVDGDSLVGRERERAALEAALARLRAGHGGLALVAGEAGVGKTRLVEGVLRGRGVVFVRGDAPEQAPPPYGPIAAALRAFLRADPHALDDCGPLARYLRILLPELGSRPRGGDRATMFEAVRCALQSIAARAPTVVFLDDLHWADATTCELLPALAAGIADERLLVVGAYRSDEIGRDHPLRRMRADLRRAGRLDELQLDPLDLENTSELAARVLGAAPARSLARTLYDRTQGFAFFVEELCAALLAAGRVVEAPAGIELIGGDEIPLPDTVRDAVLARATQLSTEARKALEVASVAGLRFDLALVAELAGEAAIDDPVSLGILVEVEPGVAAFRHTLTREAFYLDVPWGRRRLLHRRLAELLQERGARPAVLAEHWAAAHEPARARLALLAAAQDFQAAHAYRDALEWCRRALELWPADDEEGRLALLDRLGQCAELSGELAAAALAWEEVAEARRLQGETSSAAELDRRLAVAYELQGSSERALAARQRAGEEFAHVRRDADAAAELLAAVSHLEAMGTLTPALEIIERAGIHAERARRRDLVARALGLEGSIRAKLGDLDAGVALARNGLSIALAENLTASATELYLRLAAVLENAADLVGAQQVYGEAYDFCAANGSPAAAQVCLVCLAYILWETGRWDAAEKLERHIIASPQSPPGVLAAANAALGIFRAARGRTKGTRRLLVEGVTYARRNHRLRFELNSLVGLAWLEELEGADSAAAQRYRDILRRCEEAEDLHYAPMALRWAVTFFAAHREESDARACAAALADMAAATTNRETLAALAHALGEIALLEGEPDHAVVEFTRSLDVLRDLELPYQRAHTQLRAAYAFVAAGQAETAVERLTDAYRSARKLGAEPLAALAARGLEQLGERVEQRLGRRAAGHLERGGLTRRELEVLRFVAVGRTNREIAQELYLSQRTVDMHVRNILAKLDCRSRAEATHRAGELGLVA